MQTLSRPALGGRARRLGLVPRHRLAQHHLDGAGGSAKCEGWGAGEVCAGGRRAEFLVQDDGGQRGRVGRIELAVLLTPTCISARKTSCGENWDKGRAKGMRGWAAAHAHR